MEMKTELRESMRFARHFAGYEKEEKRGEPARVGRGLNNQAASADGECSGRRESA